MCLVVFACAVEQQIQDKSPANARKIYTTPKDLVEATKGEDGPAWTAAYLAERKQLFDLGVYEVVDEPDLSKF